MQAAKLKNWFQGQINTPCFLTHNDNLYQISQAILLKIWHPILTYSNNRIVIVSPNVSTPNHNELRYDVINTVTMDPFQDCEIMTPTIQVHDPKHPEKEISLTVNETTGFTGNISISYTNVIRWTYQEGFRLDRLFRGNVIETMFSPHDADKKQALVVYYDSIVTDRERLQGSLRRPDYAKLVLTTSYSF